MKEQVKIEDLNIFDLEDYIKEQEKAILEKVIISMKNKKRIKKILA